MKTYKLSGKPDLDRYLTENDMSEKHWELLMGCCHVGQCQDDVETAAPYFELKDYKAAKEFILSTGLDVSENSNEYLLETYLWIIAGDIQDRMEEERNEERKQYQQHED